MPHVFASTAAADQQPLFHPSCHCCVSFHSFRSLSLSLSLAPRCVRILATLPLHAFAHFARMMTITIIKRVYARSSLGGTVWRMEYKDNLNPVRGMYIYSNLYRGGPLRWWLGKAGCVVRYVDDYHEFFSNFHRTVSPFPPFDGINGRQRLKERGGVWSQRENK